ncbi:Hpt domain-containing protein [Pseudodesulfovibrio sediminis]|uniref:HPt domain-containing protein n=1 Tax=Pseudodesulfovibrio sediminis TaxID=2810563 RepID=A0ABN6ET94_9BACT|nr:Hpt domain-containing protein [Pseudodesulfovibrio sediminis]BCS88717.1 hypothetical protein PSDVSF_19590 [Pseudodesulfovibrio sediminis]
MSDNLFDKAEFLASLANDDELARDLLDAFLEDGPLRTGSIEAALEAGDALLVSKLAHSLKGMCGVVRSSDLSNLALSMELTARNGDLEKVRVQFAQFVQLIDEVYGLMHDYLEN